MPDMIVPLFGRVTGEPLAEPLSARGLTIRRVLPPERHVVLCWLETHFPTQGWGGETEIALSQSPPTCLIAVDSQKAIVGFLCFEVTFRGFIGPGGVIESHRRLGIFTALISAACRAMRELGYAYAIVGDVADTTQALLVKLGSTVIPAMDSSPYSGMLPLSVKPARRSDSASD